MAMSQHALARRFADGATSGRASNVQIVDEDERTLLVGYGHAVYATRDKETGTIWVYGGWANKKLGAEASDGWGRGGGRAYAGSQSTKSQFGSMRLQKMADKFVAYMRTLTGMEDRMKEKADVLTAEPSRAAPKTSEV